MHTQTLFAAALLASAATGSLADAVTLPIDLNQGHASFGRDIGVGSFTDTYSFTLTGSSFFATVSASTEDAGLQDVDLTSLDIADADDNILAHVAADPGTSANNFYALGETLLGAGSYRLIVRGINSAAEASYSGSIAVTALPEPGTLALLLAGLGVMGLLVERRTRP